MRKQKQPDVALGLFVASNRIEAVLLRATDVGYDVAHRLTRQRAQQGELVGAGSLTTALPGLKTSDEADFTLQIGNGNGASEMFLAGEFVGLGANSKEAGGGPGNRSLPFVQPLQAILAECAQRGYANPPVAYCIGAPDVAYVELFVTREQATASTGTNWLSFGKQKVEGDEKVDRRLLLELLKAQHRNPFDEARVAFVPMTPLKGQRRYLAVVPEMGEPVQATLQALLRQNRSQVPSSRTLDTELTRYAALVRRALAPARNENTAVVRISSQDTLTVFLEGTQLRHFERLRSLTTYDPPETICSRVLLQQDEQKIGELHHVIVLSEVRNEEFRTAFHKFYPNAEIASLQRLLFKQGIQEIDDEEDGLRSNSVPAVASALSLLKKAPDDEAPEAVNLLPKKLRKQPRRQLAFAWHTIVVLLLLFGLTFFFITRYLEQQAEIDRSRQELMLNPPDPELASPEVLRARVDSLKRVYTQYTHALHVLDSLLVGSDQWSRILEKTSRTTLDLSGVWFENWQPYGSSIRLVGNATSRSRVAQVANRLGASIEGTEFKDVNEMRIYPFTIVAPRPIEMPKVAEFLRDSLEQAGTVPGSIGPITRTSHPSTAANR